MADHWLATKLPSGEQRLTLRNRASTRETAGYAALVGGLSLGGLWLLGHGACLLGLAMGGAGVWSAWSLVRSLTRREAWVVSPGTAVRHLRGQQTTLTLIRRIRIESETRPSTDSDDLKLLRLFVVHGQGETPVGDTWDHTDDLEALARALGEAIGVPVDPLPPP